MAVRTRPGETANANRRALEPCLEHLPEADDGGLAGWIAGVADVRRQIREVRRALSMLTIRPRLRSSMPAAGAEQSRGPRTLTSNTRHQASGSGGPERALGGAAHPGVVDEQVDRTELRRQVDDAADIFRPRHIPDQRQRADAGGDRLDLRARTANDPRAASQRWRVPPRRRRRSLYCCHARSARPQALDARATPPAAPGSQNQAARSAHAAVGVRRRVLQRPAPDDQPEPLERRAFDVDVTRGLWASGFGRIGVGDASGSL